MDLGWQVDDVLATASAPEGQKARVRVVLKIV